MSRYTTHLNIDTIEPLIEPPVLQLSPDTPVFESLKHFIDNHADYALVQDEKQNWYVFDANDCMSLLYLLHVDTTKDLFSYPIGKLISDIPIQTLPKNCTLYQAIRLFQITQASIVPVVEEGQLIGVLSAQTILSFLITPR